MQIFGLVVGCVGLAVLIIHSVSLFYIARDLEKSALKRATKEELEKEILRRKSN